MIPAVISRSLWAAPGSFGLARCLGGDYGLRCVLFHDVEAATSAFTGGLGVTMDPGVFEERVAFLVRHYAPVGLDQVLAAGEGEVLPERAVLFTFDDAYGSVARNAAPVLERYGVPAVFFVNPAFVDGAMLGIDNLLCWTINTLGLDVVERAAAATVAGPHDYRDLADAIERLTTRLSAAESDDLRAALSESIGHDPLEKVRELGLYLTRAELRGLEAHGVEIASHTRSHVWCRNLDDAGCEAELTGAVRELEELTGRPVRAFSVPYGSSTDLTTRVRDHVLRSGQQAIFLVEGRPNRRRLVLEILDRVSLKAARDHGTFCELELLPRLRLLLDRARGARR